MQCQRCKFISISSIVQIIVLTFGRFVYASPVSMKSLDKISDLKGDSSRLVCIGGVEGKSYFYDINTPRSWTEAKEYCTSTGLNLAMMTSEAQLSFLIKSYSEGVLPSTWYWTGGREARQLRMFSWDLTGDELPPVFTRLGSFLAEDYNACLDFYPGHEYGSIFTEECNVKEYVLCESYN